MKTKILDTVEISDDFIIFNVLVINTSLVIFKAKHNDDNQQVCIVEIKGETDRIINVSRIADPNTSIHAGTIFSYKNGFGLIAHDRAQLLLWNELDSEPVVVKIEFPKLDDQIEIFENYLTYASYDNVFDEMIICIAPKHTPTGLARYWTKLKFELNSNSSSKVQKAIWETPYELDLSKYPETKYANEEFKDEWLILTKGILNNCKKYFTTKGGQLTQAKFGGLAFEFHILSILDENNNVLKNIELDFGTGSFSTNKKYFILHPKGKKTLIVYNLESLEIEFKIPLKPDLNMGNIPINYPKIEADLHGDLLYIHSFDKINICKLNY